MIHSLVISWWTWSTHSLSHGGHNPLTLCLIVGMIHSLTASLWTCFTVPIHSDYQNISFYTLRRSTFEILINRNVQQDTFDDVGVSDEQSDCRRRVAALTSSFLAAMCKAGRRTLPLESFSSSIATTRSCPCCRATANGVNPSWIKIYILYQLFVTLYNYKTQLIY